MLGAALLHLTSYQNIDKSIFTVFPDGFSFLALINLFLIILSCVSG